MDRSYMKCSMRMSLQLTWKRDFFLRSPLRRQFTMGCICLFPTHPLMPLRCSICSHHVPKAYRSAILIECRRVCSGPLYIKDHLRLSRIDDLRLHLLDAIGNIPFGGMVKADYLSRGEWDLLLSRVGYSETSAPEAAYRGRLAAIAFPNRLEVFLKWTGT